MFDLTGPGIGGFARSIGFGGGPVGFGGGPGQTASA